MLNSKAWGASLLIAGTTIGAGVLAIPLLVAEGGFLPTLFWYFVSWCFAIFTGFCILEVTTWVKDQEGANFASLATLSLGRAGRLLFTSVYVLFLYTLLVAYFCEGGNLLFRVFGDLLIKNSSNYRFIGPLIFFGLMFFFVSSGIKIADWFNRILVFGLTVSFLIFCFLGFSNVHFDLLHRYSWGSSFKGFPVIFLSFGYQLVIPSLFYYLDRSAKKVKKSIIIGLSIPLVFYILWNLLVLGIVPLALLDQCLESGHTAVMSLKLLLSSPAFYIAGEFFAFFALTSSFIGISLSFLDFLADELKWDKKKKKISLLFLVFAIPLGLSTVYPTIALKCLHYGGGSGAALLTGVFPILMVWSGRKRRCSMGKKRIIPGGNLLLLLFSLVIVLDFCILIYNSF